MRSSYRKRSSGGLWVLAGLVLVIGLLVAAKINAKKTLLNRTTREVALTCTTDMATQFHIHPYLKIVINGQEQNPPANIGIKPTCMNSLHTHDDTGKIHVEAPEKRDFTLADFFAVWDKPFSKDQLFNYKTGETHVIRVTVNGRESQEYEHLVLKDGDRIVISYEEKK